ncbi:MAG: zinc ribbon domain-containing protein [Rubrivivax sp.]
MPIYAYKCESCGHRQDALQKISDPPLSVCPACGAAAYVKQVTAAGFQLKGSGWYVTDFRGGNNASAPDKSGDGEAPAKNDKADKADKTEKSDKGESKPADTSAKASADAPPSKPASPKPASSPADSKPAAKTDAPTAGSK